MPKIDIPEIRGDHGSSYPPEFRPQVKGRSRKALGDAAGLTRFGVNQTRLAPGTWSSQRHWHTREDEFIYVLSGELTLITDAGEQLLRAGDAAGFPAGTADGHHLVNRSDADAVYLEVGSRDDGDDCRYPDVDLDFDHDQGWRRKSDGSALK